MSNKEIKMPDIGVEEVEIIEILVKIGDKVKKNQSIITVEGDKASIEIPTPEEGIVQNIKCKIGEKISTGLIIMVLKIIDKDLINQNITKEQKKDFLEIDNITKKKPCLEKKYFDNNIHASPLIRRLSRKLGINLNKVKGTGNYGRILKEDIYFYYQNNFKSTDAIENKKINFNKFGEIKFIKLNKIQKISGNNLSKNWVNIPHVTIHDQVDITNLEKFRKQKNEEFKINKINKKITILIFIIKAISQALIKFPIFNSSIANNENELILKKYINIGIAIDTIHGLLVPTLYNTDKKSIITISTELKKIFNKAHENKLTNKDIEGSCFTISSLGSIGGKLFNPIINAPEVAILGISKASINPIWNEEQFIPKLMLPLSLSFDHRVINGAEAARFMNYIIYIIHDIRNLII